MRGWRQRLGQTISVLRRRVDVFDVELPKLAKHVAHFLEWHVDMLGLAVLTRVRHPRNR